MSSSGRDVTYVLDFFHILEIMLGEERIKSFTLEEALKLKEDTERLLTGDLSAEAFKEKWNLK